MVKCTQGRHTINGVPNTLIMLTSEKNTFDKPCGYYMPHSDATTRTIYTSRSRTELDVDWHEDHGPDTQP